MRLEVGLCEGDLRAIIGWIDFRDEITLLDRLVIVDGNIGDVTRYVCRKRRDVADDKCIVGCDEPSRPGPAVPIGGGEPDEPNGRHKKKDAKKGRQPTRWCAFARNLANPPLLHQLRHATPQRARWRFNLTLSCSLVVRE